MRAKLFLLGLVVLVAHPLWTCAALGGPTRSFEMGMIYWPPQGEATPTRLINKGIDLTLDNSDHLLVQLLWSPAQTNLAASANWISTIARERHKHLTIAVDWQEPTRTGVLGGMTNQWRFADERTRALFIQSVMETADKYRPDCFVLGVEVNYYAHLFPDDFAYFVRTFREAKAQIQRVSPQTKVLVTFQYELLTGRDPSWGVRQDLEPIRAFGDDLDMLGVSTYPFLGGVKPRDVSGRYFDVLTSFHLPIGVFETSWPTPTSVAQQEQKEYLERILPIGNAMGMQLLIWTAATDVAEFSPKLDIVEAQHQGNWIKFLGLWRMHGEPKQAVKIWQKWHRLPSMSDLSMKSKPK